MITTIKLDTEKLDQSSLDFYMSEFKRLQKSEYGYTIEIRDGQGNKTKNMQLNPESLVQLIELVKAM